MSKIDIIRAWKDEEYRNSLSEAEKAQLPENPAGVIEFDDDDMSSMAGGMAAAHPHTKTCEHCCPPKDALSVEMMPGS
ncbi:mersacidin/lichenicidin family type 2 lantibiotic [Dapis sp. BLCC M126]|uniref:mersacidin/lichenicidin family type 2 lantibiotic n=1 Tax=Dapis sp. BLCC M126 TaxID=3400189 RepID=UPI003CF01A57